MSPFLKKVIRMGTRSDKSLSHMVKNSNKEQLQAFAKVLTKDYEKLCKRK